MIRRDTEQSRTKQDKDQPMRRQKTGHPAMTRKNTEQPVTVWDMYTMQTDGTEDKITGGGN